MKLHWPQVQVAEGIQGTKHCAFAVPLEPIANSQHPRTTINAKTVSRISSLNLTTFWPPELDSKKVDCINSMPPLPKMSRRFLLQSSYDSLVRTDGDSFGTQPKICVYLASGIGSLVLSLNS